MDATFSLNPFVTVLETADAFLFNATPAAQVRFAKRDHAIVRLLLSGDPLPVPTLTRYVAPSRIEELRQKKVLVAAPAPTEGRYSRQLGFFSMLGGDPIVLQQKLRDADVLLLGAGAIGSHVLWNLAAIGVGRITVVDFDRVDETNLNRQLMYTPDDVGRVKVDALCEKIRQFNPEIEITALNQRIESAADIDALAAGRTLIIKAIDTPEGATEWVNAVCVSRGIPFIAGGFIETLGIVGPVYIPGRTLCGACAGSLSAKRIGGTGPTFAPLTTGIAAQIAAVAAKILLGRTDSVTNKFFTYDAAADRWDIASLAPVRHCTVCDLRPQASAAPAPDLKMQRLRTFRISMALLFALAALLRVVRQDPWIGVLALGMLFLATMVVDWIIEDPALMRRELFTLSIVYASIGLGAGLIQNMSKVFTAPGAGFEKLFGVTQQILMTVLAGAMSISLLFFLLNAIVFGLKTWRGDRTWMP